MNLLDFKVQAQARRLAQVKSRLPNTLAVIGQNIFSRAFNDSKWNGQAWAPRAHTSKKQQGKHLLVATGRLRQAVFHCKRKADWGSILWGVDLPYAKAHNEGFDGEVQAHSRTSTLKRHVSGGYSGVRGGRVRTGGGGTLRIKGASHTVKAHHMKLPKRQFMGDSPDLRKAITESIKKEISSIFKSH